MGSKEARSEEESFEKHVQAKKKKKKKKKNTTQFWAFFFKTRTCTNEDYWLANGQIIIQYNEWSNYQIIQYDEWINT